MLLSRQEGEAEKQKLNEGKQRASLRGEVRGRERKMACGVAGGEKRSKRNVGQILKRTAGLRGREAHTGKIIP